jgi:hypothetical protein
MAGSEDGPDRAISAHELLNGGTCRDFLAEL